MQAHPHPHKLKPLFRGGAHVATPCGLVARKQPSATGSARRMLLSSDLEGLGTSTDTVSAEASFRAPSAAPGAGVGGGGRLDLFLSVRITRAVPRPLPGEERSAVFFMRCLQAPSLALAAMAMGMEGVRRRPGGWG